MSDFCLFASGTVFRTARMIAASEFAEDHRDPSPASRDRDSRKNLCRFLTLSGLGCRGRFRRLDALGLAQARGFALQLAQVEQLGPAHLAGAHDFHLVDHFGVEREDAFHALAKAHFAYGEAAATVALATGDDSALKGLYALLVAFLDADLDPDRVAGIDLGKVLTLQLGSQFFHNRMLGHINFLFSQGRSTSKKSKTTLPRIHANQNEISFISSSIRVGSRSFAAKISC